MNGGEKQWGDLRGFVAANRDIVYQKVMDYLQIDAPPEFKKIMSCYTERKGQYRRPMYMMIWNLMYGGRFDDGIIPAAAQQLSEDYVLMHDDWMDGNKIRRGLPAAHVLYPPEYAIDAGDTLHVIIWKIVNDARLALGEKRGEPYFNKFYDLMLVMHVGQYLDLRLTRTKDISKFTIEDYYTSIHAKSAYYSVYGPMQCGAIIAGADPKKVEGIMKYGTLAGNAFQIKDDILDCISTEAELGKSIGNDVREGVKTVILWHAIQNCDTATLKKFKDIYAKPRESKTEAEVRFVLDKFNELGSIDFAEKEAERMSLEAISLFEKESKDIKESNIKQIARDAIAHTARRQK